MIWGEERNSGSVAADGLTFIILAVNRLDACGVQEQPAIMSSRKIAGACPECGGRLIRSGMCFSCLSCGGGGCG